MPTSNPLLRSLLNLIRSAPTLLYTPSGTNDPLDGSPQAVPVSADNPLHVTVVGGGAGGGSVAFPVVTIAYEPENLIVGVAQVPLSAPANATEATVYVVSGSVRRSIGSDISANSPVLNPGDAEEIEGQEMSVYRMIREGAVDAQVHVEYRRRV